MGRFVLGTHEDENAGGPGSQRLKDPGWPRRGREYL